MKYESLPYFEINLYTEYGLKNSIPSALSLVLYIWSNLEAFSMERSVLSTLSVVSYAALWLSRDINSLWGNAKVDTRQKTLLPLNEPYLSTNKVKRPGVFDFKKFDYDKKREMCRR